MDMRGTMCTNVREFPPKHDVMIFRTFDTQEEFITESVANMLRVVHGGAYRYLALAGGKTPEPVYERFGKKITDPSKIFLYQVDERYVPPHHPHANTCIIYKQLGKVH